MADITQLAQTALQTGYFGVPGHVGGKVHLVTADKRPVCHIHLHPQAEFQFCAARIVLDYIECEKCREIARAILTWQAEQEAARQAEQAAALRQQQRERRRQQRERRQARLGRPAQDA